MKFALGMPGLILYPPIVSPWESEASPGDILKVAKTADRAGWDWLTLSEHVVIPREMTDVMGPRFPEAISAAASVAPTAKSTAFTRSDLAWRRCPSLLYPWSARCCRAPRRQAP